MTEPMTLEQVRDWLRDVSDETLASHRYAMADAIDARLAQPAQAVDVGAIREVIESHVAEAKKLTHDPESQDYLYEQADKLTRAITSEKAADARRYVGVAEVIGGYEMGDAGAESRVRWLYNPMPEGAILYEETVPASPAPDKEGL